MPVRYSAMNKTTGSGPSSMMAAIMVTAATCNQNEKIEKQSKEDAKKLKVPNNGNLQHSQCKYLSIRIRVDDVVFVFDKFAQSLLFNMTLWFKHEANVNHFN